VEKKLSLEESNDGGQAKSDAQNGGKRENSNEQLKMADKDSADMSLVS
jgi:hypothetical protein